MDRSPLIENVLKRKIVPTYFSLLCHMSDKIEQVCPERRTANIWWVMREELLNARAPVIILSCMHFPNNIRIETTEKLLAIFFDHIKGCELFQ